MPLKLCLCFLGCVLARGAEPLGNLSPAQALGAFETEPGFVVELVAAEPLVVDPVALAFDERGRLFVAEDRDYPTGAPDGRPLGVIALLEDANGDGVMDRRTQFAAGLAFPNGLMCWRGGLIVTAAPDVWWLADTNGDGLADVKERLLTGFDTGSTSQLRANDPTLGPDGWVYIAGGLRGGKVSSPKQPGVVADTSRGDLRFKPDTCELVILAGKSQFGLAFDDAGNRFACMNRIQSQHAPLPLRYLARNPLVVSPGALHSCPEIQDNTLMTRYTAGAARYFPISANLTTADSHFGTYSAACAVHIYRGAAFPPAYRGAAFSCDPTGNLVRGDRLEKSGGTFAALRIHDHTEALRSRDNWFRPVFLADGPDGGLYIADMYRKTIEHPEYLPGELRKHTDFESGKGMGRVWRLRGARASRRPALLDRAPTTGLVKALSSPEPWVRDTAFRLLVERHDRDAVPALQRAFRNNAAPGPAVAQLRLLDGLGGLNDNLLQRALKHPEPAVRQNAAQLAERRLDSIEALRNALFKLSGDTDPHVRFQTALSLGETADARAIPALARIAEVQAGDRWTRAAILSSLRDQTGTLALAKELARRPAASEGLMALAGELGRQTALRTGAQAAAALASLRTATEGGTPELQIALLAGFAEAAETAFRDVVRDEPAWAADWFAAARERVADGQWPEGRRLQCLRLLAWDDSPQTEAVLRGLLAASQPRDLQTAAARGLLRPGRSSVAAALLDADAWSRHTPALRQALVNALAGRAEFASVLLDAVQAGTIPAGILTPGQRDTLRKSKDSAIQARAGKLLEAAGGDRRRAFDAAKAVLKLAPAPANGRVVFERACATCHRLNQQGVAVGPDLFDIRQQPKETILYHIIVPEAEIAPNFLNYECELKDGRSLAGLLAAESGSSITLRMAQGVEEIVPRAQILRLEASRLSLMPQELENTMTPQDLADLLAYLRGEAE